MKTTSKEIHDNTVKVVQAQKSHLGEQLVALDDIATRIRTQNDTHYDARVASLDRFGRNIGESNADTREHFTASFARMEDFKDEVEADVHSLQNTVSTSDKEAREPLQDITDDVRSQAMAEYVPTGDTPERQSYTYPSALPSTESREKLLAKLQDTKSIDKFDSHGRLPSGEPAQSPPPKSVVFTDFPSDTSHSRPSSRDEPVIYTTGNGNGNSNTLRQLDVNILSGPTDNSPSAHSEPVTMKDSLNVRAAQSLKRQATASAAVGHESCKLPKKAARKTVASAYVLEGSENIPVSKFSSSVGPGAAGRRLRSHVVK